MGGTDCKYFKLDGRYYVVQSFRWSAGGTDADVGAVVLDPTSRTASIYRRTEVAERYRCAFGLNPDYLAALHHGGLRVSGVSEEGLAMAVEFADHPFFFATLFMPEHRSRAGAPHPLISAYLDAAARRLQ